MNKLIECVLCGGTGFVDEDTPCKKCKTFETVARDLMAAHDNVIRQMKSQQAQPMAIPQMERMVETGCAVPGCTHADHDHIYVNQRCHPRAGLDARYTKGSGKLVLECHECKKLVMEVAVALI